MSIHSRTINEMANEKLAAFYGELRRALGADAGELVDDGDLFEIVETIREQRDAARSTVVKVLKRFGFRGRETVEVFEQWAARNNVEIARVGDEA